MVTPFINSKEQKEVSRVIAPVDVEHEELRCHILLPNVEINGSKQLYCHLCNLIHGNSNKRRSNYGCIQCSRGFHVSCFAAFHHRDKLVGPNARMKHIINAVETVYENQEDTRKRKSDKISSMQQLKLPDQKFDNLQVLYMLK